MKSVITHNVEFGYELISAIPYAYWLHERGMLSFTESAIGTEPLYYFSPKHVINRAPRSWYNTQKLHTPNVNIHKPELDLSQFSPPPYKEHFANNIYNYDVVICNRYGIEWPGTGKDKQWNEVLAQPINFFDLQMLEYMVTAILLWKTDARIAYLNLDHTFPLYHDRESPQLDLGDREFLKMRWPDEVHHIKDILADSESDINTTQLQVMANCPVFITMNGGYSILASYFGGTNIIYTKPTKFRGRTYPREIDTGDFGYYHHFGGSDIKHCLSYKQVLETLTRTLDGIR